MVDIRRTTPGSDAERIANRLKPSNDRSTADVMVPTGLDQIEQCRRSTMAATKLARCAGRVKARRAGEGAMSRHRIDRYSHEGAPSGAELARVNSEITRVMGDVIRQDRRDVWQRPGITETGGSSGAAEVRGTGWVDSQPLAGSVPYQDAIARIADGLAPHSPEYILRQRKLSPAQLDELRRQVVERGLAWLVPIVDRVRAGA